MSTLKEVYDSFNVDLISKLPMKDAIFIATLNGANLFQGNTKAEVQAQPTSVDAATFFLDKVIDTAWDNDNSNPRLDKLLTAMKTYDSNLKSLANKIKTGGGSGSGGSSDSGSGGSSGSGSGSGGASGGASGSSLPAKPNNIILTELLKGVADWKKLATFLLDDADGDIVVQIEKSSFYQVEDCRATMIRQFVKSGDVTWKKVIDSLKLAGYRNLAIKIEKQLK